MKLENQWMQEYLDYCKDDLKLSDETLRSYSVDLKQFYRISEQNNDHIESYMNYLNENLKEKSIIRKLNVMRSYFDYLNKAEKCTINPFSKSTKAYKTPEVKAETIPNDFIKAILETARHRLETATTSSKKKKTVRDLAMIELLLTTGIRPSELYNLKTSHVQLNQGILIIESQDYKNRTVPIQSTSTIKVLNYYYHLNQENIENYGFFFLSSHNEPMKDYQFRKILALLKKETPTIPTDFIVTPLMFRNTFIKMMLESGMSVNMIKKLTGLKQINATLLYQYGPKKEEIGGIDIINML